MRDRKLDMIRLIPGMEDCKERDLARLCAHVDIMNVAPGYVLVREGTISAEAFLVCEGEALVTVGGELLATAQAGDWVGELGMIGRSRRSATVTAATQMVVLAMSVAQFAEVTRDTRVGVRLEEIVACRRGDHVVAAR